MTASLAALAIAAVLGICALPALAAVKCDEAITQADMNQCAASEHQAQEKRINAAYAAYRRTLEPEARQQLKAVQLAWIRFRDLTCKFEVAGAEGGSIYSMAHGSCLARYTAQRADDLERMGKCEEGDVTCRR